MSLRIAQITDCHLQAEVTTPYKGVDADAHLDQCLAWLQDHAQVDLLMLTGDLSHFGSEKAYQRLQQKLSRLAFPCVWLAWCWGHVVLPEPGHCPSCLSTKKAVKDTAGWPTLGFPVALRKTPPRSPGSQVKCW